MTRTAYETAQYARELLEVVHPAPLSRDRDSFAVRRAHAMLGRVLPNMSDERAGRLIRGARHTLQQKSKN